MGKTIPKDEIEDYYDFFNIEKLISNFKSGQEHLCYRFRRKNSLFKPMVAEQHIYMYDDENGDVCGFSGFFCLFPLLSLWCLWLKS